ncbi:MAG: hypothetical protein RLY22_387 [Actinomycetota bacterium]
MRLRSESGTVTAELAIAMPAVLLTLTFSIQALSVQSHRIELTYQAAQLARDAARGESVPNSKVEGHLVCVQLEISEPFPITEKQCARQLGS